MVHAAISRVALSTVVGACVAAFSGTNLCAKGGEDDWPAYGRDPGGMRHAAAAQITPQNVDRLAVAWTYHTRERDAYLPGSDVAEKAAFEATPIVVDGVLYLATPTNRVIALDAKTGTEKWVYDPKVGLKATYSEVTCRGVSTWAEPDGSGRRVFVATIDGRLVALEAGSGNPCADFGPGGVIDLKQGVVGATRGLYQATSPPAILNDLVIVGSSVADNTAAKAARGVVRAFDARTGALRWAFDPVPRNPGDPGYDTWRGDGAHETGAANVWPPISVDTRRNVVFLATTCPSPDYFGGRRLGDDLYSGSVVCLRGGDGQFVWGFQTVRHDLWDYDVPMQPLLLMLEREGRSVDAVAVGTKSGHLFVLDRDSGKSLFPNEDRPVPRTDVAGEETAPTQPFPAKLPVFGLRRVTADDAWGPTEATRANAAARIAALRSDGPFTPPSLRGSIHAPGPVGGFNWGGLSYDPARGLLVGATNRVAAAIMLIPRDRAKRSGNGGAATIRGEIGGMNGTPFVVSRDFLLDVTDANSTMLPQTRPPWGTLVAVDLRSGSLAWEVPLGLMADPAKYPDAEKWGSVNLGGPVTTAGGVAFVAASMDGYFRAFDTASGKLLWKAHLPAGGQATPMSYVLDGRQYVVICAGGHGKLRTKTGDSVVAFALPEGK